MASRKFELSREGKDLRLSMAQGDITLTRLATAFQVSFTLLRSFPYDA